MSTHVDHDLHLSRSELNYDSRSEMLQLSICLFLDDMELALAHRGHEEVKLYSTYEDSKADLYIEDYLRDRISFVIAGDTIGYTYLGREISDDLSAVWCYIEVPQIQSSDAITVTNQVFNEIYADQTHVMVITRDMKRVDHWILDEAPFTEVLRLD